MKRGRDRSDKYRRKLILDKTYSLQLTEDRHDSTQEGKEVNDQGTIICFITVLLFIIFIMVSLFTVFSFLTALNFDVFYLSRGSI